MKKSQQSILFLAVLLFAFRNSFAETPDFTGTVQSREDVKEMFSEPITLPLFKGERDLVRWADELEKSTPQTPKELWTKYEVCLRAGRDDTVVHLLPVIRDLFVSVPKSRHYGDRRIGYDLYRRAYEPIRELRRHDVRLHSAFFENFGPVFCWDCPIQRFQDGGWSDEQITDWLRRRYEAALAYRPRLSSWSWHHQGDIYMPPPYLSDAAWDWQGEYLKYLQRTGKDGEERKRLAEEAEKNPSDMTTLSLLFRALRECPMDRKDELPKLDWFAETASERSAFDAAMIAFNLYCVDGNQSRKDYLELSVPFWRRALETPLAEELCREIHEENARYIHWKEERDDEIIRARFRSLAFNPLNGVLLDLERNEEAQAVMEEGRRFREKHGLSGYDPLLAGETQGASGYRVVEADILAREPGDVAPEQEPAEESEEQREARRRQEEEEKLFKETDYWTERADYYLGRKELQQREDALRRGLALFDAPWKRRELSYRFEGYYNALLGLFKEAERKDDIVKLFLELHALTEGETHCRTQLYRPFLSALKRIGEEKILYEKWRADVEKAVAQARERQGQAKDEPYDPTVFDTPFSVDSLMGAPIGSNRPEFNFDNTDPLWWEVLPLMTHERQKMLEILVLRVDAFYSSARKTDFDAKAFEKAKAIALDEKDGVQWLEVLAWAMLHTARKPDIARSLLETALERTEDKDTRRSIQSTLWQACIALGDWRQAEELVEKVYDAGGLRDHEVVGHLQRVLKVAEKEAEPEEVQRLKRRLANLGVR